MKFKTKLSAFIHNNKRCSGMYFAYIMLCLALVDACQGLFFMALEHALVSVLWIIIWASQRHIVTLRRIIAVNKWNAIKSLDMAQDINNSLQQRIIFLESQLTADHLQQLIDEELAFETAFKELGKQDMSRFHCGARTSYMKLKLTLYPEQRGRSYPFDAQKHRDNVERIKYQHQ